MFKDIKSLSGPTSRITILYMLALGMVALLTIIGQIVVQRSIISLEGDSRVVNFAGRQRMLSQRLTRLAFELALISRSRNTTQFTDRNSLIDKMRNDLKTWTTNHNAIQFGSEELHLPGSNSPTAQASFLAVSPYFDAFRREIEATLSNIQDEESSRMLIEKHRDILNANSDAYLAGMDEIVSQLEYEARNKVNRLRWIESILLIATICVLVGEGVFIFSPAIASLNKSILALRQLTLDLSEARSTAEKANLAKTEFLARVSHELRTPLHAILGMLSLVQREKLTQSQSDRLRLATEASASLKILVDDLLDIASIEHHRNFELHPRATELTSLIHSSVELMRPTALEKGLALQLEFDATPPLWVQLDSDRLRQIITNLLQNALRYTEKGSIYFHAIVQKNDEKLQLQFEIRDTGVGIARNDLATVFECFERGEQGASGATFGRSMGLGLSIVHGIVTSMGGRISLESELGKGSCFQVSIPILAIAEPVLSLSNSFSANTFAERPLGRALIVDDGPINLKLMRGYLKLLGYRTLSAMTLNQAIECFRTRKFDIVLMDKNLPDGNGATFPSRVQRGCTAKLFLVTADISTGAERELYLRDFNAVLTKPLSLDQLSQALQGVTSHVKLGDNKFESGNIKLKLSQLVKSTLSTIISELRVLFESRDFQQIQFLSHRLRGSAGNAGLREIADLSRELEHAAEQQDVRLIQSLLQSLDRLA